MKKETVNINLRLLKSDYELLKFCKEETGITITQIVIRAIHKYLNLDPSAKTELNPVELKPLQNLKNPTAEIKKPLEIPVIPSSEESSVIESSTFGHRLERKLQPNWGLVMRAYRAQKAGKEFDESLEPYFKELFSEKHP